MITGQFSSRKARAGQRFVPSVSLANGFFNRLFLSFVSFFSFLSLQHRHSECCTVPRCPPSDNAITLGSVCLRISHPPHASHRNATHHTAPHRNAMQRNATQRNLLSAAEPTPEERTWNKSVTLLQSHSSPELPVSPDESFASSCSLRNARNDRQLSANPCSLPDPSFATVSGLPERTSVVGHRGRGRKYERSRSEVTLLSTVELFGEFRSDVAMRTDKETVVGVARGRTWYPSPGINVNENFATQLENLC